MAELQAQAQAAAALLQGFDQVLARDQALAGLLGTVITLVEPNAI